LCEQHAQRDCHGIEVAVDSGEVQIVIVDINKPSWSALKMGMGPSTYKRGAATSTVEANEPMKEDHQK
jgi:hypothetical protein